MRVAVVTPSDPEQVLPLADAKQHLRVDDDSEDTLITAMRDAALGTIDGPQGWLGRCVGVQTLDLFLDRFDHNALTLPYGPVQAVDSVRYLDGGGQEQTVDPSAYRLMGDKLDTLFGHYWPTVPWRSEAITVRYDAGYLKTPAPIVAALKLMVGDLYTNRDTAEPVRGSAVAMSTTVDGLLAPFRIYGC